MFETLFKYPRETYARSDSKGGWSTKITPDLESFLATLDAFYIGTATAEGQPYVQHRGGPAGFLRVLDDSRLAFADFGAHIICDLFRCLLFPQYKGKVRLFL